MILSFSKAGKLLSADKKKTPKPTTRKFRVTASSKGVEFSIDHQGFTLYVEPEGTKAQTLKRYKWYARQLSIALKRLKESK